MTKPTLDQLLCTRPASLTLAHAEACLPTLEINPEWQAKQDAGELREDIKGMVGSLRTVWPEERFTAEEARWVLAMREHLSWRSLGDFVLGNGNQITGMHLEEAARRVLSSDIKGSAPRPQGEVAPRPKTYLITRHSGARQWVQEEGIVVDAQLDHLEVDQVRAGDIVVGSLPVNLAAEVCARGGRYFHLSLELPFDWRGRELSPGDMRHFGARVEEFRVERRPCKNKGQPS